MYHSYLGNYKFVLIKWFAMLLTWLMSPCCHINPSLSHHPLPSPHPQHFQSQWSLSATDFSLILGSIVCFSSHLFNFHSSIPRNAKQDLTSNPLVPFHLKMELMSVDNWMQHIGCKPQLFYSRWFCLYLTEFKVLNKQHRSPGRSFFS